LLDAGLLVVAERGDALTATDVVVAADVSNGTFYNHFDDRDDFMRALAYESLAALTERSADRTRGADPAWRFAVASMRVLDAGARDPVWARAVLRLHESPTPIHEAVQGHLRADLAAGHRVGRFSHGDDPVTVDLVSGTLMAALRRVAGPAFDADGAPSVAVAGAAVAGAGPDFLVAVVTRLLQALGVEESEAHALAFAAYEDQGSSVSDSVPG
jgi:AcrR family transcriptional regulator